MKFKKRAVVVEARRVVPSNYVDVAKWCGGKAMHGTQRSPGDKSYPFYIRIPTLKGIMIANINDWVIEDVEGEFYPCKPDVFAATYDLVEGEPVGESPGGCNCGRCEADGLHWSDCAVHGVDTDNGVVYTKPCSCDGPYMSPAQINKWRKYNDAELEAAIQSAFVQGWSEGRSDIADIIEKMKKR